MQLPTFRYHPDPISTESIKISANKCVVCGLSRGYIYTGPVYAIGEYQDMICPWCIADGRAYEKLQCVFVGDIGLGGAWGEPISQSIVEEISHRTPGFSGWQQEQWLTHCQDAAAYLGRFGQSELLMLNREQREQIKQAHGLSQSQWEYMMRWSLKDGSPTLYVFQCLHCGVYGGYSDSL